MKHLPLLVALFFSGGCYACYSPPAQQLVTGPELLANSSDVSLATAVGAEANDRGIVQYHFEVVRRYSGPDRKEFDISGFPAIWEGNNRNFSHHSEETFWETQGGRESNDTDCQIHPTFSVGGTYLVFLGQPYTRKSFELIIRTHGDEGTRDKWLQYVEKYFSSRATRP